MSLFVFFTAAVRAASQISKLPSQLNHANHSGYPRNRHRLQLAVLWTLCGVHLVTLVSLLQVRLMDLHLLIGRFANFLHFLRLPDNCSSTASTTWHGA